MGSNARRRITAQSLLYNRPCEGNVHQMVRGREERNVCPHLTSLVHPWERAPSGLTAGPFGGLYLGRGLGRVSLSAVQRLWWRQSKQPGVWWMGGQIESVGARKMHAMHPRSRCDTAAALCLSFPHRKVPPLGLLRRYETMHTKLLAASAPASPELNRTGHSLTLPGDLGRSFVEG